MRYFVTGFTGSLVPWIVEALLARDSEAFFYLALRKDRHGTAPSRRFAAVVREMGAPEADKQRLLANSCVVEIDVNNERLGIEPDLYREITSRVDKVLHGAADVRFDRPYESIRVPNVVFTEKILELFHAMEANRGSDRPPPALYYISTAYAYGQHRGPVADTGEFAPGSPENTYEQTKAESMCSMIEHARASQIVIFEPTIIGGSSRSGRTRKYNLFYSLLLLGYLNKLPFLAAPKSRLDIVPVDWVAEVISKFITGRSRFVGTIRLAAGDRAISTRQLRDVAYDYYARHKPDRHHVLSRARFLPRLLFLLLFFAQTAISSALCMVLPTRRLQRRKRWLGLFRTYLPYMLGDKVFDNARSNRLIERHCGCPPCPSLHDRLGPDGKLIPGYLPKLLRDTLQTGWGGRLAAESRGRAAAAKPASVPASAGD